MFEIYTYNNVIRVSIPSLYLAFLIFVAIHA